MKWENVDLYKNSIIVLVYKKHHFSTNIKSIIVLIITIISHCYKIPNW